MIQFKLLSGQLMEVLFVGNIYIRLLNIYSQHGEAPEI
jgi:hypothetical protein